MSILWCFRFLVFCGMSIPTSKQSLIDFISQSFLDIQGQNNAALPPARRCPQYTSWCMLHHVAEQLCRHGVSWAMGIVGVLLSRIPQPQLQQLPRLKSFWTASVFTWWMGRWLSSCGGDRVARSCPILKQSHLNCFNFLRSSTILCI